MCPHLFRESLSLRNWLEPGVKKESLTYFMSMDLAVLWGCFLLEKIENEGMGITLAWAFQPTHFLYKWASKPKLQWSWAALGWTLCSAVVGLSAPASLPTPTPFQNMPCGRAKLSQNIEEDHSLVWVIVVASSASDKFSGPICSIKAERIYMILLGFLFIFRSHGHEPAKVSWRLWDEFASTWILESLKKFTPGWVS